MPTILSYARVEQSGDYFNATETEPCAGFAFSVRADDAQAKLIVASAGQLLKLTGNLKTLHIKGNTLTTFEGKIEKVTPEEIMKIYGFTAGK